MPSMGNTAERGGRCVTSYVPRWRADRGPAGVLLLNLVLEVACLGEGRGGAQVVGGRLWRRDKGIRAEEPSLAFEVALGKRGAPEGRPVGI